MARGLIDLRCCAVVARVALRHPWLPHFAERLRTRLSANPVLRLDCCLESPELAPTTHHELEAHPPPPPRMFVRGSRVACPAEKDGHNVQGQAAGVRGVRRRLRGGLRSGSRLGWRRLVAGRERNEYAPAPDVRRASAAPAFSGRGRRGRVSQVKDTGAMWRGVCGEVKLKRMEWNDIGGRE